MVLYFICLVSPISPATLLMFNIVMSYLLKTVHVFDFTPTPTEIARLYRFARVYLNENNTREGVVFVLSIAGIKQLARLRQGEGLPSRRNTHI